MKALARRLDAAEARIPVNCLDCPWRKFQHMPKDQIHREVRDLEIGNMVCAKDDELEDLLEEVFSGRYGLTFDIRVRRLAESLIAKHSDKQSFVHEEGNND